MTAIAARSDLARWAASAAVVVGLHAIGVATLLAWQDPVGWGDGSTAIVVDLTPFAPPSDSPDDLAPGPLQQQAAAPAPPAQAEPRAEPKPEEVEAKLEPKAEPPPEQKIDVPPAPVPPVAAVPPPEAVEPPVTVHEPEAQPAPPSDTPPAPVATAPPRQHPASPAAANRWHKGIYAQIKLHQAYPAAARARGQKGVVQIAFAINRQGRVVSSRVEQASGHAALDRAALETIEKAQPFEPPPPDMPGDAFSFTVPLEFKIR